MWWAGNGGVCLLLWIFLWLVCHNAENPPIWNKKAPYDGKQSVTIHTMEAFVQALCTSSNKPCRHSLTLLLHSLDIRQDLIFVQLQPGLPAYVDWYPWLLLSCIVEGVPNLAYIISPSPKLTWLQKLAHSILHHPAEFLHGHLLLCFYKLLTLNAECQLLV